MRRSIVVLVCVVLIVGLGELHRQLSAQQVVAEEQLPIISPTYIAVPPKQQEVITVAPSPQHVWVSGQWERTPDKWTWSAGQWVQPPFSNAYWTPGYWKHSSGKYLWQPAHWAAANQGVIVAKPVTVPPIYAEVQPAAPTGPNYVWQPGYWEWRGTWVWVAGEYIQTTQPKATWVPGQWVATTGGNWSWNPAHWAVV